MDIIEETNKEKQNEIFSLFIGAGFSGRMHSYGKRIFS